MLQAVYGACLWYGQYLNMGPFLGMLRIVDKRKFVAKNLRDMLKGDLRHSFPIVPNVKAGLDMFKLLDESREASSVDYPRNF